MSASAIKKVSNISDYINSNDALHDNLQSLTKILYEYGQHEKSYKKSNKKARNLIDNELVTKHFDEDEIWCQIRDHSRTVLSTVDQRAKYRQNERQRMQQILDQLQQDVAQRNEHDITDNEEDPLFLSDQDIIDTAGIDLSEDTDDPEEEEQQPQDAPQQDNGDNEWWDVIQDHRSKQLKDRKAINKSDDKDAPQDGKEEEEDDTLDMDSFQKQTDEMEAFINQQWDKEKEMAEDGAFDLLNDDMFERALIFDEEHENNTDKPSVPVTEDKTDAKSPNNDDDFAFLKQHIAKDSDDEQTAKKNGDEWQDLFNLPKFSSSNTQTDDNKEKEEAIAPANLSKFELEERAIKERIAKLEEENMKQRTWEYQGEVSNNTFTHPHARRDKNSLLSTYLDFDYADKLKPKITDDLNSAIENLIITKIKSDQFDDVEKKRDFANAPKVAKRKLIEIQDTKSSMGLAELYEREYLQQIEEKQKLESDETFMSSKDAETTKQYERISRLKSTLFYELDQLIRFHYEPKQAVMKGNIKVKTNTSALHLEEMLPFAMSTENTMTPEQIYRKPRKLGHIKGENEMTKEDRKSKRRANKKRGKHWKFMRNETDQLRAGYDEKFSRHLSRIKALNEVRTHAMAAAKKNGFMRKSSGLDVERDDTKYTSSKQMFAKIQQHEDNARKKRKLQQEQQDIDGNNGMQANSLVVPPEKR
eukprot:174760_1